MTDWGRGKYELTAAQLAPISSQVIDSVEPVNGERLLDIACGTGNAALEAARRGARAVGLDSAPRLLAVARERAGQDGLEPDWIEADMEELPFPEDSFDVVVSVFGTIFGDPGRIAGEIARVLVGSGRMAITSWEPAGVMERMGRLIASHAAAATGSEDPSGAAIGGEADPFSWGRAADLEELFAGHGIVVHGEAHRITFRSASPEAQAGEWFEHQPMFLAVRDLLGEARYEDLRADAVALLHEANEDPGAMAFTSGYLVTQGSPV